MRLRHHLCQMTLRAHSEVAELESDSFFIYFFTTKH